MNNQSKKEIPLLITITSILCYVAGGILAYMGLSLLLSPPLENPLTKVLLSSLLFFLPAGLLIFIGNGLWKGKNWARVVIVVVLIIFTVQSTISVFKGDMLRISGILINILIGWYLIFSKSAEEFFSS